MKHPLVYSNDKAKQMLSVGGEIATLSELLTIQKTYPDIRILLIQGLDNGVKETILLC